KISILSLYICCIFLLSSILSLVSRYLFSQTAAGQNTQESVFHFTFIISFTKSKVQTKAQILQPQAEKVFEIEKSSIHSKSL
ncbi:MAG: hypothetical protein LBC61_02530, partial [Candidatus Peribacteria bacterium]|nr:hypothetical protein [Candidatus Peribacteria bacterium]